MVVGPPSQCTEARSAGVPLDNHQHLSPLKIGPKRPKAAGVGKSVVIKLLPVLDLGKHCLNNLCHVAIPLQNASVQRLQSTSLH